MSTLLIIAIVTLLLGLSFVSLLVIQNNKVIVKLKKENNDYLMLLQMVLKENIKNNPVIQTPTNRK